MNKYSILNQKGERVYLYAGVDVEWPEALERGRTLAKDVGMDGVLYFEYWHGADFYCPGYDGVITRTEAFCAINNAYDPRNNGFNEANLAHLWLMEHGYRFAADRAKALAR